MRGPLGRHGFKHSFTMFLRFTTTELHEGSSQPIGIFHAVRYLRDDGLLTGEQEEIANDVFDWLYDHLDAPGEAVLETNREAVSWFRATATDHIAQAERLIPLLKDHGYCVTRASLRNPGTIVYADTAQVLALPPAIS
jgi:hypothetical protein